MNFEVNQETFCKEIHFKIGKQKNNSVFLPNFDPNLIDVESTICNVYVSVVFFALTTNQSNFRIVFVKNIL